MSEVCKFCQAFAHPIPRTHGHYAQSGRPLIVSLPRVECYNSAAYCSLLTFVFIGSCKLLEQVMGADAAKEHMVFRESRPRYFGAQRLNVLSCRADKIDSLQVLHRLVLRIHPFYEIHLLLEDL